MSPDIQYLALRLEGPLQAWGVDSQYSCRNTTLMPSRSAIAGMICAALGLDRGSKNEKEFLVEFEALSMLTISIPRQISKRKAGEICKKVLPVRRLNDYHTVQNTKTASGSSKDCHITQRQYLTDAAFGVLLTGKTLTILKIAEALADPIWGIWFGRKSCIPSAPVLAGIKSSREECLKLLLGNAPLKSFTRQEETETFAEGRDSLSDVPISFASNQRQFSQRRVRIVEKKR
jgi:CRISPR system Cascade subunit CasD